MQIQLSASAQKTSPGHRPLARSYARAFASPNFMAGKPVITVARLIDLVWAAGFADGEGCISYTLNKRRDRRQGSYRVRLQLCQNNPIVLKQFIEAVGEKCVERTVKRYVGQNRQVYSALYDGAHAFNAIAKLAPFLRRKKEEAELILASANSCAFGYNPGIKGHTSETLAAREKLRKKLTKLK